MTDDLERVTIIINGKVITNGGVTLDGDGHTLTGGEIGDLNPTDYGVRVTSLQGVTVKNLNIEGYTIGIAFEKSSDGIITENSLTGNGYGIQLSGASSNTAAATSGRIARSCSRFVGSVTCGSE